MATTNQTTVSIANEPRIKRRKMAWSSLESASRSFDVASWIFWGSLFIGVIATAVIILAGIAKESYWRDDRAAADVRIAELERIADEAKLETARVTLKLEELRAKLRPRSLQRDSFFKALEGRPKARVEILFPKDDSEAYELAMQLRDFLRLADWKVIEPAFIPQTDVARFATAPSAIGAGGQPTGVTIVVRSETQEDFALLGDQTADTPFNALRNALLVSLGIVSTAINNDASPPRGMLRIVVGPKPQVIR